MSLLTAYLRKSIGSLDGEKIISLLYKVSIAAIIMGIVIQALKYPLASIFNLDYFWGIFGQGFICAIVGIIIYSIICWLFKVPEFIQIKESLGMGPRVDAPADAPTPVVSADAEAAPVASSGRGSKASAKAASAQAAETAQPQPIDA
jgi:hypothetical protein